MASVVKVALGRHVFCRRYATDGLGHLRFAQEFRARAKTSLAWTGPTAACYQWRLEAAMSTNLHALIIDMAAVNSRDLNRLGCVPNPHFSETG